MEGIVSLTTDCSKNFHETGDHNANVKHTGPQSQFIHLQTLGFSSPSLLYLSAPQQTAPETNQPASARFAQPSVTKRSLNRTALSLLFTVLIPRIPHPFTPSPLHPSPLHPFTPTPLHPSPSQFPSTLLNLTILLYVSLVWISALLLFIYIFF